MSSPTTEPQRLVERLDCAWKMVTCAGCGETYQCTPSRDYYNNTTFSDGVCDPCLLSGKKGANPPTQQGGERRLEELAAEGTVTAITDDYGERLFLFPGPAYREGPRA